MYLDPHVKTVNKIRVACPYTIHEICVCTKPCCERFSGYHLNSRIPHPFCVATVNQNMQLKATWKPLDGHIKGLQVALMRPSRGLQCRPIKWLLVTILMGTVHLFIRQLLVEGLQIVVLYLQLGV